MGLEGSWFYMNHLPEAEKTRIAVYLNHEILGAPNGGRFIMGTDENSAPAGSEKIAQLYAQYQVRIFVILCAPGSWLQHGESMIFIFVGGHVALPTLCIIDDSLLL